MSGPWLASYIALWAVVLFQGAVIFVLLRQLGVIYLGTAQGVAGDGLAPGAKAPSFEATGLEGQPVALSDYLGRSLLLVFGSPTCGPCRSLIPDLNAFAQERREELGVLFLSHGKLDATQRFATEHDVRVPVAAHPDDSLANSYKARVTPFAFLIDPDGVIQAKGLANNREHLDLLVQWASEHKNGSAERANSNGAAQERAREQAG